MLLLLGHPAASSGGRLALALFSSNGNEMDVERHRFLARESIAQASSDRRLAQALSSSNSIVMDDEQPR